MLYEVGDSVDGECGCTYSTLCIRVFRYTCCTVAAMDVVNSLIEIYGTYGTDFSQDMC